MPAYSLEKIKKDVEAAVEAFQRIMIRQSAFGEQISPADVQSLLSKYGYLFEDEMLAFADDLVAKVTRAGNRTIAQQVKMLKARALQYRGMILTAGITTEIHNAETKISLDLPWGKIPYRNAIKSIQNEPDKECRKTIYYSWVEASESLVPLYSQIISIIHDEADDLGFDSFLDMMSKVGYRDHDMMKRSAKAFLDRTKNTYMDTLDTLLQEHIETKLSDAHPSDVVYLRRGSWLSHLCLGPEKMVESVANVFHALGYEWGKDMPGLTLDLVDRAGKSPRAFCASPRVPDDVYLCCKPRGGFEDFLAYYHESGHAIHMLHVDPTLDVTYRLLGDPAISEMIAFLFEHILHDPRFLEEIIGLDPVGAGGLAMFGSFLKLHTMRHVAGRYLHELDLHAYSGDDFLPFREKYIHTLHNALGYMVSGSGYLSGDYGLYSADYLAAWFSEAQVRKDMVKAFGSGWYLTSQAGAKLVKEIFRHGGQFSLSQLGKRWKFEIHDAMPTIEEMELVLARNYP